MQLTSPSLMVGVKPKSGGSVAASADSVFGCIRYNCSADHLLGDKCLVCRRLRMQTMGRIGAGNCRF